MIKNTGILIYFDETQRAELIHKNVNDGSYHSFTDALSISDWNIGSKSLALLSFHGSTIDYIAIAEQGRRAATAKNQVKFSEIINVNAILLSEIENQLGKTLKEKFITSSRGIGKSISHELLDTILNIIKKMRPNLANEIDRIVSLLSFSRFKIQGDVANILLQERDALGTVLDIFSNDNKLREQVLGSWAPKKEMLSQLDEKELTATFTQPKKDYPSFISGLSSRYLQEESAIQHDLINFTNYKAKANSSGFVRFEQGHRILEVIYANRNALESTLGVDLIYYNQYFDLFCLIQYKLMKDEGNGFYYRPDSQCVGELGRMDVVNHDTQNNGPITSNQQYRLNSDGFMFKLVPNRGLTPASGELIKGMYLPREYMHFLLSQYGAKGKKGGACITFENSPRYLTNTQFIMLMNQGLIGSRGMQSDTIKNIITKYYETGKTLMVAVENSIKN